MKEITIEKALLQDKKAVIDILVLALCSDPVSRWKYSTPHDYLRFEPKFYQAFSGDAFETGSVYVANKSAGAAIWLKPGSKANEEMLESLAISTVKGEKLKELDKVFQQFAKCLPKFPHWHLQLIGVDPIHQGKRLGAALMEPVLAICDQSNEYAYLEATSERGMRFYEQLGFKVIKKIQFGSSPTFYAMLREPAGAV